MSKPKRYDPAAIETKWQSRWENEKTYACHVDKDKKNTMCWKCFPILRETCTWDMYVTTPSAT